MTFRRNGNEAFARSRSWEVWRTANAELLTASGIPPSVIRTREDWLYFLRYGYHCDGPYPAIDFRLDDLNGPQVAALGRLLELTMSDEEKIRGGAVWHTFYPPG